jgi:hypothetical protein
MAATPRGAGRSPQSPTAVRRDAQYSHGFFRYALNQNGANELLPLPTVFSLHNGICLRMLK